MDVVQPQHTYLPKFSGTFMVFYILLLASDLPTVRQFLLKQAQLESVTLGNLIDTRADVIDTVKVLKCHSGLAT